MKNSYLLFVILFFKNLICYTQTPGWTDFNQRQKLYPTESYLTGYASETDVGKKEIQYSFEALEPKARGILIEKVQVKVSSKSTSETNDYDGVFNDFFKNETQSTSTLNLVGLKVEQYYEKKKKTCHTLVYVKRVELINFYKSQLNQDISKISSLLGSSRSELNSKHIQESFKAVFSTQSLFKEVEDAQGYLTALGVHQISLLRNTETEELSIEAQKILKDLEKSPEKNLDDVNYCTSLVLSGKKTNKSDSVYVSQITYEETGLVTAFSYRNQQLLRQQLSSNSSYSLQEKESSFTKLVVQGTYWDKGEYIEIKSELYDKIKNTSIGSFKTKLFKNKIEDGLEYISSDILNLEQIKELKLRSINQKLSGQVGFAVTTDLKVKVTDSKGNVVSNIPIQFVDEDKGIIYGTVSSNGSGLAIYHIDRVKSGNKSQTITAKLDLDSYLSIDKNNKYVQDVLKFTSLPNSKFYLSVKPSLIYFVVDERNFGRKLGIPVIEAGLKDQLSSAGYKYTTSKSQSDLIVSINADTRRGGEAYGIFYSFVDITVSVAETKSGKEVFKKSFNGYKSSGTSFEHAGGKSYQVAKKDVCDKVLKLIGQ